MTTLPTLYSKTAKGQTHSWSIEVEDCRYRTVHGLVGGKMQTTKWTVCYPTNEGRANYQSAEDQALAEAQSLWTKKKSAGGNEDASQAGDVGFFEPMLAQKFSDREDELTYPVYSQTKIDGARLVATQDRMHSRDGKEWVSVPHIRQALNKFFEEHPNVILDGELYNHELHNNFNKIMSLVRKTKPTQKDIQESAEKVQYWIYDMYDPQWPELNFAGRLKQIELWVGSLAASDPNSPIKVMPTQEVRTREGLDEFYNVYLQQGFEGQIVRTADGPYENKRSKHLLKRKEFSDKEYTILDIGEGAGNKTGVAGFMVFQNEQGTTFNSNIKGNRAHLKEIWENKESYIGREATIRFFNLTTDNIPRFPYVYDISEGHKRND